MKFTERLMLGTLAAIVLTAAIVRWGSDSGIPGAVLLALVGVLLLLAWWMGWTITRPLAELAQSARDIAAGATPAFPHSRLPEVDALVRTIRQMQRDLAEHAQALAQEKQNIQTIVEAMVEGVISVDARGRVLTANPAARRLLRYDNGATLPAVSVLFHSNSAREAMDALLAGTEVNDTEIPVDDRIILLNGRPLPDGGGVIVLHDLTDVRRLEAMRRDFVANVSHELKTPLTSITGYAETISDPSIDSDTRAQFVATILSNAKRMQRLIDELLDLSRIESGGWRPHVASVDVGDAIREAWEGFVSRAAAQGVRFASDVATDARMLLVDPAALRQILINLFDNALRYTPAGGTIAARAVRRDGELQLLVRDTGSGIAGDHLPRIFERFYRVDAARSRDAGGTGLGLAIVRHLVEAHGGRVSAESELQAGTTIILSFVERV